MLPFLHFLYRGCILLDMRKHLVGEMEKIIIRTIKGGDKHTGEHGGEHDEHACHTDCMGNMVIPYPFICIVLIEIL